MWKPYNNAMSNIKGVAERLHTVLKHQYVKVYSTNFKGSKKKMWAKRQKTARRQKKNIAFYINYSVRNANLGI